MQPKVVLASASPRRARILESLGIPFRVAPAHVDESLLPGEEAAGAARRLAIAKATAAAGSEALPILAADTIVVCDDAVLGKPGTREEAAAMLRRLSGRTHEVVTAVCLLHQGVARAEVERTQVRFAALGEADIRWYVATGEPMDKAGAYHVDGRGAAFVLSVSGSPSNVEGLPVTLVLRLAAEAGLDLLGVR